MTSRSSKGLLINALTIRSVWHPDLRSMRVDTKIINEKKSAATKALIDSGAQGVYMDKRFAKKHGLPLIKLSKEIPVSNVDNTPNQNGPIKEYTRLPDRKEFST